MRPRKNHLRLPPEPNAPPSYCFEQTLPSHRCPVSRAAPAKAGLAAVLPGLCPAGIFWPRALEGRGHRHVWRHPGTGLQHRQLAFAPIARPGHRLRCAGALLAGRGGHQVPAFPRPRFCSARAVCAAAGADAAGDLVCRLLPGAQPPGATGCVCLWRRSQSGRLCPRDCRCRCAGADCLPGTGATVP